MLLFGKTSLQKLYVKKPPKIPQFASHIRPSPHFYAQNWVGQIPIVQWGEMVHRWAGGPAAMPGHPCSPRDLSRGQHNWAAVSPPAVAQSGHAPVYPRQWSDPGPDTDQWHCSEPSMESRGLQQHTIKVCRELCSIMQWQATHNVHCSPVSAISPSHRLPSSSCVTLRRLHCVQHLTGITAATSSSNSQEIFLS